MNWHRKRCLREQDLQQSRLFLMSIRSILVNSNQKGNPILQTIKQSWEFSDIIPDYIVGKSAGVLFLSLKYHRLHPEYIQTRIPKIQGFDLKVLLVLVDVVNNQQLLREISKIAFDGNISLLLAWSSEDAARYLETLKAFETKTPDHIREKVDQDPFSKVRFCSIVF
jgi:DNA excision repair protein ERCC-1